MTRPRQRQQLDHVRKGKYKVEVRDVQGSASFMANVGSALLCKRWDSFSP